ncbi:MAG: response regulator transcription factor [Chloroflexi bacterium SZAS-1]|nr:response regulator transcription factor [Chloroflexi bacterium SZAS-1]HNP85222.1 response regulator transcription factor [Kouleothrix sp.]
MSDIRVLIAEDQTLMRQGLRMILELSDGFTVVGEAEDGQQAIDQALALRPDIVLMDVQMPNLNGVAATAQLSLVLPTVKVIILTTFDYDEYVFDGIKAGARGYMLKDILATDLLESIRKVYAGESIVQASIATRLIAEFSQRRTAPSGHPYDALSQRELEVLRLLAGGMNNKTIATQLALTEGTVKNYVSTILDKLHAANRTHATTIARKQGLID